MRWRLALVLVFAALPSSASAATVEVAQRDDSTFTIFRGEGNEGNDVRYSLTEDGRSAVVRDNQADVRPGAGCEAMGPHAARCAVVAEVRLELGAGPDVANAMDPVDVLTVDGGPGNDAIFAGEARSTAIAGGDGVDILVGTAGNDTLSGGAGSDRLSGGGGDDSLEGDPAAGPFARDVFDGGDGADLVSYGERTTPVQVDLAVKTDAGTNGGSGEHDQIEGVERALGGLANDLLTGDDLPNRLSGGGGADVLVGRNGADVLLGSEGADRLDGGDGDDFLDCGVGKDRAGVDVRDLVASSCERTEVLGLLVGVPRRVRRGFVVSVRATAHPVPCKVVLTLTTRRRAVRSRAVRVRSSVRVTVRSRVRGRRRPAAGRVRVEVRGVGCGGVGGYVLSLD
jgi:Ca2+-binding RTX toxin-like protein